MVKENNTRVTITISKNKLEFLEIYCKHLRLSKTTLINALINDFMFRNSFFDKFNGEN